MGEVVFGIDFKARRMAELERNAAEIMHEALFGTPNLEPDTSPCEMLPYHEGDSGDCA